MKTGLSHYKGRFTTKNIRMKCMFKQNVYVSIHSAVFRIAELRGVVEQASQTVHQLMDR